MIHEDTHGVQAMDLLGCKVLMVEGRVRILVNVTDGSVLRQDATFSVVASQGKLRATAYLYRYELPKIGAWLQVVKTADLTCAQMGEEEF